MTKKHFKAIAETINYALRCAGEDQKAQDIIKDIAASLATMCQKENERFDRGRFMAACGIDR